MTEAAGTERMIAVWVLRVTLGLAFLTIGVAQLTGTLHTVETFAAIGWGHWFRYVTGLLDIIGALLVLMPRWTWYGALLLAYTVGFAAVLSLRRPLDLAASQALALLAATLAWLTRPREAGLTGSSGLS